MSDNLHVDGLVEGRIHSEAEVAIGQEGRIEGELQADHIVISGGFEGSINARRLEIVAGGRVRGDLTAAELVIEPGALFNGNILTRRTQAGQQPAPSPGNASSAENKSAPQT
ncbi:MAG TPA: polymer-forming cytoskeletal protein [Wenzhouxiangella sp.]|nr:polymer-forming cytoskeletal protein [Wenzhouxiangella sp.]